MDTIAYFPNESCYAHCMQNHRDIIELSDHVLLLLRQKRLSLKTSLEYDLLSSHAKALQILSKQKSLAVGEIKNQLGLSFGSATKIIDSLEQKRLVGRKKFVKSDLRSTEVSLTQKGRKVAQEIEEVFASHLQESLGQFSEANKRILLDGIKTLLRQFDIQNQSDTTMNRSPNKSRRGRLIRRNVP